METRNYTFDETILSDLYKDAYGSRPREYFWADWDACNDEGKQMMWDRLVDVVGESVRNEEAQQKKAIDKFEGDVLYALVGGLFRDRTEVIQHYHRAFKTNGDVEALEFELGVPFGYISKKNWG